MISGDPILGKKYDHPTYQKNLLDHLLRNNNNLKELKKGQGAKRYIFKEEDEQQIRLKLKSVKKNIKEKTSKNEYQDIIKHIYLIKDETGRNKFDLESFRRGIKKEFDIKSDKKIRKILKDLKIDGYIGTSPNCIHVLAITGEGH